MTAMNRLDNAISLFSTTMMVVCMSTATIVAFVNVVGRYALGTSITWAAPLTEYLFIWSALFGAAHGFKIGMHIGVTALIENLPRAIAKYLLIINLLIMMVFLGFLVKWAIDFIQFSMQFGQIEVELRIPFWTIYTVVPLSMSIAIYQLLLKLYLTVTTPVSEFTYDAIMKDPEKAPSPEQQAV
ncbi:MAG: TRAP transporter small permease [Desulfohalobiaceae bacterium]|nr:TRAP transporter small permease [Desulfohalobiaceae bacterium]MCF8085850.1 TRAP transporter small permease [Desulfohalobiaceae bacterium]